MASVTYSLSLMANPIINLEDDLVANGLGNSGEAKDK